jgi:hypothetical protein
LRQTTLLRYKKEFQLGTVQRAETRSGGGPGRGPGRDEGRRRAGPMVDGLVVVVGEGEGGRFLLVGTTGPSTALACRGPALALPRGSARSFACGRG